MMSQNNSNETIAIQKARGIIEKINAVEEFDPTPLAVDYTDLKTGETMKRLPVMIQIAWFKLKYPESKIAVQVTKEKEYFVAKARIYANYKDPVDCYLSEASASRTYSEENPSVSPREWAQTAAIGIALRNAGFGLQFQIAGEVFDSITTNEFEQTPAKQSDTQNDLASTESTGPETDSSQNPESEYTAEEYTAELTDEEKLEKAYQTLCPITKYSGKTLAEVLTVDPHALVWVANKYKCNPEISEAAKLICEHALSENNE